MTKTERTIYALVGPVRYNTLSFSLAIDTAMELLFVRKIAMDDIRVTRDIYAPTAARLGKTTTAVSRQIVRLCNLCWDTMQDTGEVEQYIGKPIRDLRAPNEMIFYFKDGHIVPHHWESTMRKDCWTDERRAVQNVPALLF